MIIGLGTDIIEIARIKKAVERQGERFLQKLLTQRELDYCTLHKDPFPRIAGRFAAKEAILKAVGTGLTGDITWHDIEIQNEPSGKPFVVLHGSLFEILQEMKIHLSISHCREYATAAAIIEKN